MRSSSLSLILFALVTIHCTNPSVFHDPTYDRDGSADPPSESDDGTAEGGALDGAKDDVDGSKPSGVTVTSDSGTQNARCEPTSGDCTCVTTQLPDDSPSCPPATMPNPVCCAQGGYPTAPITSCGCSNWACTETADACTCLLDATGMKTGSACTGHYAHCCESILQDGSINSCTCGSAPCESGQKTVTACSTSKITCVPSEHRVTSCK